MKEECVVGVYDSIERAERAVRILKLADFRPEQISIVASNRKAKPEVVEELKLGDDSVRDAAVGAGLGGILGILAGIGLAVSPIAGMIVFLIGPIGGAATGTVVGGLVGAMFGWGVRKDQIESYEQMVRAGKVLVIVNGNPLELVHAERILRETQVAEVNLHSREGSDAPEVYAADQWPLRMRPSKTSGAVASPESAPSVEKGSDLAFADARERFQRAARILTEEKGTIKERLLAAYASQLSLVNAKSDLPEELQNDFFKLKDAISDAEMPYGSGQRAAQKIEAMTEDEASAKADEILSIFKRLSEPAAQRTHS